MKKKISVSMQNRADLSTTGVKHDPHLFLLHCWVFLAACTLLTLFFAVNAQTATSPNKQNSLFTEVDSRDYAYRDDTDTVARSRAVQIDITQLGGQQQFVSQSKQAQPARTASSPYIQLNLFDDLIVQAKHKKNYKNDSGSLTWIGKIEGQSASLAIFIIRNSSVYGLVEVPNVGSFSIRPNAEGTHTIEQIKANALLAGEDDFIIPDSVTPGSVPYLLMNDVEASAVEISNDDGSIIDVYVAYDQDASGGSVAAVDAQSYAELFIAYTNQSYENSNISQRVWLAGSVDGYNYTDTDSTSLVADLDAARSGTIAGLHDKRDEYHADLVMFFTPYDSTCNGRAGQQTLNNDVGWNIYAFAAMTACSFGQSVFAHELGHTMGSRHDWYMDSGTTPASIAHGYVDTINNFRTIMSYSNRCTALGISCPTIPNFSNPAVGYNGGATGVPSGTSSACAVGDASPGIECDADNTTNFNTKALITSRFRDSRVTWTGAVDTNWATAGNWTFNQGAPGATTAVNRVPRSYDNVYIPAGLTNYPTISGTASARELAVADGATLNMTTGTLTVGWGWEDNGGFNATGGTVVFAGPIGVTVTSSSSFQNVQIGTGADTSVVSLEGNVDINGNLHIQAGASFDASSYAIHLAGNWTEDDATGFTSSGTSTVVFDGSNQTVSKVTNVSLLNEDFSSYSTSCCTTGKPSGWANSDGSYYQGDLIVDGDGAANRWRNQTDGYLYTPALNLQKGVIYQLQYDVAIRQNFSDGDASLSPQTVSVHLGNAQSSTAMTTILSNESTETSTTYETRTISNITVATSGTYYIGFRAQQSGDDYTSFDDISLTGVGSISFYNLLVSSGTTTFGGDVRVDNNLQTDNGGTIDFLTNSITVEGTVINNGAIKQTKTATNSTTTVFGWIKNAAGTSDNYYGLEITPSSGSMGETTVEIKGNQTCSGSGVPAAGVKRCYTVTPVSSQAADVKFYYRSAESNSNTTPDVYLQTGGSWAAQATSAHGGSNEAIWATGSGLTSYGTFSLSSGASSNSTGFLPAIFLLLLK
ncbi:hypothetical protein VU12_05730 [Desulfobulbus sp. US4]|nr:hypothetical protein [Desulfobulbus sp. US4]